MLTPAQLCHGRLAVEVGHGRADVEFVGALLVRLCLHYVARVRSYFDVLAGSDAALKGLRQQLLGRRGGNLVEDFARPTRVLFLLSFGGVRLVTLVCRDRRLVDVLVATCTLQASGAGLREEFLSA